MQGVCCFPDCNLPECGKLPECPDETKTCQNRIEVFHHLTYDEIAKSLNVDLFDGLLDGHYDEFVAFCEKIKSRSTPLTSISCYIENDQIHFEIDE